MAERELIKIACDNEIGYYTQFKDEMKEGEKEYSLEDTNPPPDPVKPKKTTIRKRKVKP